MRRCSIWGHARAPPSHEAQDEREVIGEYHAIAEGKPVQAAIRERELLMDRKKPRGHACDTALEDDKEGGAVRECHVHQGIRLTSPGFQVEQGQEGVQEGAHADQDREPHDTPRQTIDVRIVSLPGPPKAFSPALPAYRTHECCGSLTSISQAAPVERLSVPYVFHIRRFIPEVVYVRREETIVALEDFKSKIK
jgi:hypothetical protein